MDSGDTAQRSLEHWSESGLREMEEFYVLATEDYRQLALAADWAALLGERAHQGWSLLDVACGSGKFPTALVRFTAVASLPDVAYDLLDPSAFSVATARAALAPPFMPRNDLVMPLQELPSSCGPYDVVSGDPCPLRPPAQRTRRRNGAFCIGPGSGPYFVTVTSPLRGDPRQSLLSSGSLLDMTGVLRK